MDDGDGAGRLGGASTGSAAAAAMAIQVKGAS
jgi:hypothetical protein